MSKDPEKWYQVPRWSHDLMLARLALLEKVLEAAERLADTVDGYDDLVRSVWDAIAACEEVKP